MTDRTTEATPQGPQARPRVPEAAPPEPAPSRSAAGVRALQRTAGNAAVTRLVGQKKRQPARTAPLQRESNIDETPTAKSAAFAAAAPSPLGTIGDFISLVERVEAAYPGEHWMNITTRIRKVYYDTGLWNQLVSDRKVMPSVDSPPLKMPDFKALVLASQTPEVKLPDGQSLDVGHVLTGVDSTNFPRTGGLMDTAGMDGPTSATWAGDVGSALAWWDIKATGSKKREQRDAYYTKYASSDDMLGNVDGIALAHEPAPGTNDAKLSARLRKYYLEANGAASKRYTKFAKASGFGWKGTGSAIKLDAQARATITSKIDNFAVQYRRHQVGTLGGLGSNWFYDEDIKYFVDRFITWVEAGLAAENP